MSDNNEPKSEVLDFDNARSSVSYEEEEAQIARNAALRGMPVVGQPGPEKINVPMSVSRQPIASQPPAMTVSMTSQELVTFAVLNDKLDMLDKVIALKNAEEDRAARLEFDRHFSEMQKDYEPVRRSTKGQFGVFADLNAILSTYGPILARHGFSNSWEEEDIPGQPGWKRIWNNISGYGHTKRAKFDCPPAPTAGKNAEGLQKGANEIQMQGIQTSYGKRYTFCSNAGVILTDEDKDGATFEDGIKLGQFFTLIRESKTQVERKANYMMAIKADGLTDREKSLISEESKKKAQELHNAGVKE